MSVRKNQTPGVATPPAMTIVIDPKNPTNRESLVKKISDHLRIKKENINFCTTAGSRSQVVEEIIATKFHSVLYYETPTGITELYIADVKNKNLGEGITQYHVQRDKGTRNSLTHILTTAEPHFNRIHNAQEEPAAVVA